MNGIFLRTSAHLCVTIVVASCTTSAIAQKPLPIGSSTITIGYDTNSGPVSFTDSRNWDDAAFGAASAIPLGDAPNIRAFNAVNSFGRRTFTAQTHPEVLGPDETLVTHGFFKDVPAGASEDFFPDIAVGSDLTIRVEGMQFDRAINVDQTTFLMHALWNEQADQLDQPYFELHNQYTATDPYRDSDAFEDANVFTDILTPNTVFEAVSPQFTGEGTDTIAFEITVPYSILKNLEETGQQVPDGLPAPQGFLEPFHFHFEYVVVPEPTTLMLMSACIGIVTRRRRNE